MRLATSFTLPQPTEGYKMMPGKSNLLQKENLELSFSDRAFYDTVLFEYSATPSATAMAVSEQFALHNYKVPVHDSFTVRLKQTKPVPPGLRDKIVMQLLSNKKNIATKGVWQNDWMEAKFRDLGRVQLIVDTIPPRLTPIGFRNGINLSKAKAITFLVQDDVGEIKDFRAEMDGKWLMFSRKNDYFIHKFDERTSIGLHELKVTVSDEAGNVSEKTYNLTR